MNREIRIEAPAKINLHLEVGGLRSSDESGECFHELRSLFQIVSLCDTITVRSLKHTNSCRIFGEFSCPPEKNLIYRAYLLLQARLGRNLPSIEVQVIKRIPEGAGLGGGSSDAAALLKCLNRLFQLGLSSSDLARFGAELGSDVPFFFFQPLALVGGRGEKVKGLSSARREALLLVLPEFSVSTGDAFRWLDQEPRSTSFRRSLSSLAESYLLPPSEWGFFNSFTPVLRRRFSVLDGVFDRLQRYGACFAEVSGSGSSVFAFFPESERLQGALEGLTETVGLKELHIIEMLDRFPDSILQ